MHTTFFHMQQLLEQYIQKYDTYSNNAATCTPRKVQTVFPLNTVIYVHLLQNIYYYISVLSSSIKSIIFNIHRTNIKYCYFVLLLIFFIIKNKIISNLLLTPTDCTSLFLLWFHH